MYKLLLLFAISAVFPIKLYADATQLTDAINNVRTECGNVVAHLDEMKKKAGINTAVAAVAAAAKANKKAKNDNLADVPEIIGTEIDINSLGDLDPALFQGGYYSNM